MAGALFSSKIARPINCIYFLRYFYHYNCCFNIFKIIPPQPVIQLPYFALLTGFLLYFQCELINLVGLMAICQSVQRCHGLTVWTNWTRLFGKNYFHRLFDRFELLVGCIIIKYFLIVGYLDFFLSNQGSLGTPDLIPMKEAPNLHWFKGVQLKSILRVNTLKLAV
jgi:hypothetical protein